MWYNSHLLLDHVFCRKPAAMSCTALWRDPCDKELRTFANNHLSALGIKILQPQEKFQVPEAPTNILGATSWDTLKQNHSAKPSWIPYTHRLHWKINSCVFMLLNVRLICYMVIDYKYSSWYPMMLRKKKYIHIYMEVALNQAVVRSWKDFEKRVYRSLKCLGYNCS